MQWITPPTIVPGGKTVYATFIDDPKWPAEKENPNYTFEVKQFAKKTENYEEAVALVRELESFVPNASGQTDGGNKL